MSPGRALQEMRAEVTAQICKDLQTITGTLVFTQVK